ncbi:aldehyde ferredoxin oxidoreductase family protein [Metallumcola ferriviriculae]|uniref:Aldehyde ferredoxin oxidoreductase family protein n=1 Tax=Metallumcola ferriviriculae TaxID=3039180 RepID=A0AAU0UTJ1_9FIRM|nr:aldehyde ferredoxin oxidoreductase family protein [Desulfitibacteraceae bacterium MK1]
MNNTGYHGRLLYIDLTAETHEIREIPKQVLGDYVGGKGLAAYILNNETSGKIDSLGKENLLIFAAGPLTGTNAPATRGVVVTCSPLTGGFVDSYYGGHFAQELKYAGIDALVVAGQAEEPVYLYIEDEEVQVKPAGHLWGTDTFEANKKIKEQLADQTVKVASIGPAGENQVPFALVSCEYNRQAGRGGVGAVMGSKKLKGIAVKGTGIVSINDNQRFAKAAALAREELAGDETVQELTRAGTASSLWFADEQGLLPVENYRKGTFNPEGLAEDAQKKEIWLRDVGCASCPIRCSKVGVIRKGKRKGTVSDIVEYETAALMGANLGLTDIREVAYLVYLCDALGLDGMSAGSVVGFAMECFEKGIFSEAAHQYTVEFGSAENIAKLLTDIANRRGPLGELLSMGTAKASQQLGKDAQLQACHVKGMDIPAWGPRGVPGMGLAYLTADRGACHQRAFPINYEVGGVPWDGKIVDRLAVTGKAAMVIHDQNYSAGLDTLVKCDFGSFGITAATYLEMLAAATGVEMSESELMIMGERIWNTTRLFNLRQGLDMTQERLPKRFFEPLPDGPAKGHRFTQEDQQVMLQEYYALRGWDESGRPREDKLNQLNISKEVI